MKPKKKTLKIVLWSLGVTLVLSALGFCVFLGLGVYDGVVSLTTNAKTMENVTAYFNSLGVTMEQAEAKMGGMTAVEIPSTSGDHVIPAKYFKTSEPARRGVAILIHGLGGTKETTYPVAQMFLNLGYDALVYDQRSSGENTADHNTFGYLESLDLTDCVDYVDSTLSGEEKLAVWGCSFGGATLGMGLGRDTAGRIDYAVFDCPVSDGEFMVNDTLADISEETGLPLSLMLFTGDIALKAKLGFNLGDLHVADWVKDTATPVLVFNSEIDETTPAFMGQDIYDAVPHANKKIVTVADSKHAEIFNDDPALYQAELAEFLGAQ